MLCDVMFTAVDWSEFHVWSPNAVYKELNRDRRFPSAAFRLRAWPGTRRLDPGRHGADASVRIVQEETKNPGEHRHPGLVREAYVQFSAGALGKCQGYMAITLRSVMRCLCANASFR